MTYVHGCYAVRVMFFSLFSGVMVGAQQTYAVVIGG
jgi:hypothetical protein